MFHSINSAESVEIETKAANEKYMVLEITETCISDVSNPYRTAFVYWIFFPKKKNQKKIIEKTVGAEIGNPTFIYLLTLYENEKLRGKKSIKLALQRKSEHIYNRRSMEWASNKAYATNTTQLNN